mmetsp:Transcript_20553/g.57028  ORF Transcript_20553/g.57028 Transcript_20553/m.57028 type:complete len:271 (+) Transcript_20553:282-1094(+)
MKFLGASATALAVAAISASNTTPFALALTHRDASPPPRAGLLVDPDGNLYSPSSTPALVVAQQQQQQQQQLGEQGRLLDNLLSIAISLRGGDLYVDGEGNLYSPPSSSISQKQQKQPRPRQAPSAIAPADQLRGGAAGGLCVDDEGNLFYSNSNAANVNPNANANANTALQQLRGGAVAHESSESFYERWTKMPEHEPDVASRSRRKSSHGQGQGHKDDHTDHNHHHHTHTMLTKHHSNSHSHSQHSKPTKKKKTAQQALLEYNNSLMET